MVSFTVHHGDCVDVLDGIPDESVDLIVTSPPYSKQRSKQYGGVAPEEYVQWFGPIADKFHRALKPTGTFILNIKEHVKDGERHTYVLELILAMRENGWLWTEEYIWRKTNSFPGVWPNRFRDGWERLLQFNKQKQFAMYQDAVMVPAKQSSIERANRAKEKHLSTSRTGSGITIGKMNWKGRKMAFPDNVLELNTEAGNKGHSAAFPDALPRWFINLFTQEGDVVCDPFMGSGSTVYTAYAMHRHAIGIDIKKEYCDKLLERMEWDLSEYLF